MKHYYLYQITNNLNGKIYIGVHQTNNIDDGYMGSGKVIRNAIAKYGIENFTKVILETFENAENMYAREKEVVTEEFLSRDDVYNLRRGGHGGFEYIKEQKLNGFCDVETAKKARDTLNNKLMQEMGPNFLSELGRRGAKARNEYISNRRLVDEEFNTRMMENSRNSIAKASIANTKLMWITNGERSIKVDKNSDIPEGWRKGRVGNFVNKKYLNSN